MLGQQRHFGQSPDDYTAARLRYDLMKSKSTIVVSALRWNTCYNTLDYAQPEESFWLIAER